MPEYKTNREQITRNIGTGCVGSDWADWHWHVRHAVRDIETLQKVLNIRLSEDEVAKLSRTIEKFPLSATPYYLSLVNREDFHTDPIYRQAVPMPEELITMPCEMSDPLAEDSDSPVPGLIHRYPDRVLFHVSNVCAMYCRHCTRKRKVGERDFIPDRDQLAQGLDYIRNATVVRDVLLSGGDPLLMPDDKLEWLLAELRAIPHVEIIRIGSRTPVVLPYRITEPLVNMLKKYHPLWLNTQFNHPRELSPTARAALARLADAGIPLGNQAVLLAGVNDCPRIMRVLCQRLLQSRVRPYYLYQCDLSEGLGHFRTPVGKGIEIMESMIGHTSGLAVPTYVIDAPHGGGKIPVMPNYLISWSTNKVVLRNYEGVITTYKEPDSYERYFCDRNCEDCHLQLRLEGSEEREAVGIHKLLADYDEATSLTPAHTERFDRRNDEEPELGEPSV